MLLGTAVGDPLGGCCVTPYGYSVMLKKLMDFAHGKIVLALEGGYNIKSTANSMLACVKVLLEDKSVLGSSEACPLESTWTVIQAVRQELKAFWPTLGEELPKRLINGKTPTIPYVQNSTSNPEVEDNEGPTTKFATENFDKLFQFVQEIEAGPSLVERIMQNCWPPGLMNEISKYNAKERCQLLVQGLSVIGSAVEELEQAYSDDQANVDNLNGLVHALRVELEEERAVKAKLAANVAEAEKKAQEAISEKMKSDSRVAEVEARVTTMEAKIAEERRTLKGTLRGKEEEILRLQEQMFEVGILRSRIAELEQVSNDLLSKFCTAYQSYQQEERVRASSDVRESLNIVIDILQKSIHAQIAAVKERMADAKKLNLRYQTEMQVLAAELYKEATEQALLPPERRKFTPESYARKMGVEPFNFNVQYYLDRLGAEVEVQYPEWVLREIDAAERAEAETSKAVEADMRNPCFHPWGSSGSFILKTNPVVRDFEAAVALNQM